MEKDFIYYVLGALAIIYLLISRVNKQKSKSRRDRKFMGDYKREDEKE